LSETDCARRIDWPRVHIFWGDERCVPPDHPDSNYRMARETLLDRVPIPTGNIHRLRGEIEPAAAEAAYAQELHAFFAQPCDSAIPAAEVPWPRFDLIFLGLGEDGHTASLFPGTTALFEQKRWVVAHYVTQLQTWRITLTLPVINAAAQVTFMVAGERKAERLRQLLSASKEAADLPAHLVKPTTGELLWLVDAETASRLKK